ncbi:hypothetical protein ILUMI_19775 [Ignelater luminosus]|uniref:YqaJ viral recombinase domain-containing protein n=1 Tax=Ignelater luminosus TaxID=2038154 RepID=A0A8K0CL12_IGNLU|nr:hypothetical protein ILUMI_19775 [Ignelater luminosus]
MKNNRKRRMECDVNNADYGENAEEVGLTEDEVRSAKEKIFSELKPEDVDLVRQQALGQHDNVNWFEARRNRLTASWFGQVCIRRDATPCHNLVKNILYGSRNLTAAIMYERLYEKVAIHEYKKKYNVDVSPCGFVISREYPYLGASPDGLINDDGLLEVKSALTRNLIMIRCTTEEDTSLSPIVKTTVGGAEVIHQGRCSLLDTPPHGRAWL